VEKDPKAAGEDDFEIKKAVTKEDTFDDYHSLAEAVQRFIQEEVFINELGLKWERMEAWDVGGGICEQLGFGKKEDESGDAKKDEAKDDSAEKDGSAKKDETNTFNPSAPSQSKTTPCVLISEDFFTNSKGCLVLIPGTGTVRAGIWGRNLCITDSIENGTIYDSALWAKKNGYSVISFDPNWYEDEMTDINGGAFHCVRAWFEFILGKGKEGSKKASPSPSQLFVWAHSFGGPCFIDCLHHTDDEILKNRLKSVAFTDSVHFVDQKNCLQTVSNAEIAKLGGDFTGDSLTPTQRKWLEERGVHWREVKDMERFPLDMVEPQGDKESKRKGEILFHSRLFATMLVLLLSTHMISRMYNLVRSHLNLNTISVNTKVR
jgi:hypothetical protein